MNMERGPLVSILKYMLIHEKIKEELIEYMGMFYILRTMQAQYLFLKVTL